MKLGILGTGRVAQLIARRWGEAGHDVTIGSRRPAAGVGLDVPVTSSASVVAENEIVLNATPGAVSLRLIHDIGVGAFDGRILVDVANANTPDFELVYPNSSLGELLQEALPNARVVKTMNTAAMTVMTDPSTLSSSSVFVSGDDERAKGVVSSLLTDFGWSPDDIVDLGGISSARGAEHYFVMFAALMQSLHTPQFNIRLVR